MADQLGTTTRPLRVAIVGSGPSGFYAAEALLNSKIKVKVDVFERLPAPFGLVRYGVAPDHPKIKNVIKIYEKIASHGAFSFFGNVTIGRDLNISELQKFYDAVIFASGAERDKPLGIPGQELPGSYTATEFVAWYNGHPEYRNRTFDLSHEVAVIVGQGNVAMDVSRILCKNIDELKDTDISRHALEVLAESKVREVHLVGRRGPVQAAFTPAEIKEFGELKDCDPVINPTVLKLNPQSQAELEDPDNVLRVRNWDVLKEFAARPKSTKSKKFFIRFLRSPLALVGSDKVQKVVFEVNELTGLPGQQTAKGTGKEEELDCGIFFSSVGYRGLPILGVPFNYKKGIINNRDGRVMEGENVVKGLYAVGWIKRGPTGVIGTNRPDSLSTVENLIADIRELPPCETPDTGTLETLLKSKGVRAVSFSDWKKIDSAEIERGKTSGKPREKFVSVEEMLGVLS